MPGLTERQLDLYKQQGYLLIEEVFDPSLFDALKGELDGMVSAGAERAHEEVRDFGEIEEVDTELPEQGPLEREPE